jgi:hypothetical protein
MFGRLIAASLILVSTAAVANDDHAWRERGAETLAPFKQQLKSELMEGMKEGTANAIDVCSIRAPEIAEAVGSETVTVGRTSHKLRNPANAPRPWIEPLLDAYVANPHDPKPRVVHLENGGVGYVEPITVGPICLTCHGSSMSDATKAAIDAKYPADEAIGFENGDFRGLFWIEFGK